MSERWQREVQKLRDVEPGPEVWDDARTRTPESDGGLPPTRQRLVAGLVAFAVFVGAAFFVWQTFRPSGTQEPIEPATLSATIAMRGTDEGPSASLSFEGSAQEAVFEGYTWCPTPDDCTEVTNDLTYPPLDDGITMPVGTPFIFEGGRVERFVVRTTEGDRESANVVVDTDGTDAAVPDEPGDYLIWIAADWDQGSGAFYLRVRATALDDPDALLRGSGTVLQAKDDDVPVLCLGGVADSLPPQCDGIPIKGWDWQSAEGEETASGTTWGSYEVLGTYDGDTFTLDEVVGPPTYGGHEVDFTAPCDEPEGGWVPGDPSKAGMDDFTLAMHAAEAEPDSTAVWIDQLDKTDGEQTDYFIGIFGFTGDLERHEAELRELWGGPICVFQQTTPLRELRRIQQDLGDGGAAAVGLEQTDSGIDVTANVVEVGAIVTSEEIEQALADRYGDGTVRVVAALVPA